MKFFNFCFLLILNFSKIYGDSSPLIIEAYRCVETVSTTCTLRNIFFNDGETVRFIPKYNKAFVVTKVVFEDSRIPILTSDICDNFPDLKILIMKNVYLKKIMPGALNNCKQLREIFLQLNFLEELDKNTFKENKLLTQIFLSANNLTNIPTELFKGLSQLQILVLNRNRLSQLPVQIFSGLELMESINIQSNPLLSLEMEIMKKFMPKLKDLYFRDLDLSCDRVREIYEFCEANMISTDQLNIDDDADAGGGGYYELDHVPDPVDKRLRSYIVNSYNGFECISNEQHEREVLFRNTIPNLLKNNSTMKNEVDLQTTFENFKQEYSSKIDNMMKEMNATQSAYLFKIFEGQNFIFNLLKEKIESLENQIKVLNDQRNQNNEGVEHDAP